ncbi:uncharacterized protein LOC124496860 [Dermatophagoides farinae]|uniref:uncharacterized protein LOC124496860 n=1 Tax=Dermatophagoides farinae TaxID=6954 RepID=UPI003F623B76
MITSISNSTPITTNNTNSTTTTTAMTTTTTMIITTTTTTTTKMTSVNNNANFENVENSSTPTTTIIVEDPVEKSKNTTTTTTAVPITTTSTNELSNETLNSSSSTTPASTMIPEIQEMENITLTSISNNIITNKTSLPTFGHELIANDNPLLQQPLPIQSNVDQPNAESLVATKKPAYGTKTRLLTKTNISSFIRSPVNRSKANVRKKTTTTTTTKNRKRFPIKVNNNNSGGGGLDKNSIMKNKIPMEAKSELNQKLSSISMDESSSSTPPCDYDDNDGNVVAVDK